MPSIEYSLSKAFEAADAGPVLRAQLFPLANKGAIRQDDMVFNRYRHALYCDPSDTSPFEWVFYKSEDGATVKLTTALMTQSYGIYGPTVAVRRDRDYWYLAMETPSWSTDNNNVLVMNEVGFQTINLRTVYGEPFSVEERLTYSTPERDHSLHMIVSNANTPSNIFLGVTQHLQPRLDIPLVRELDLLHIAVSLAAQSVSEAESMAQMIRASVGP